MERPCVLIADDRPADLLTLQEVLADPNYDLVTATSGRQVLQHLQERLFAVILLDVYMPDMDGFTTAELIRKNEKNHDVPIIFLTGMSQEIEQTVRAYGLNAVDYITKPFEPHILKTKVKILVELFRKTDYAREQTIELGETAQQLQEEIAAREVAEEGLRQHQNQLESLVAERTQQLLKTTERLKAEISERERLGDELKQLRIQRERQTLDQVAKPPQTSVTAQTFGTSSLSEVVPTIFDGLVERYATLLDQLLEMQAYRVDYDISPDLRALADEMGALRATPRDLVEIHDTALKRKTEGSALPRAEAYIEEGRLMLVELMGYLITFYRRYTFGSRRDKPQSGTSTGANNG